MRREEIEIKGIIIAGTHSGAGKTTLALGLMAALRRRGLTVAAFKVGPDFIDPGHHAVVTGRDGRTLDGWMLSRADNLTAFQRHAAGADIAVVEGVMGLFDGVNGCSEEGSTAQMAKWLDLPVLLAVDAAGMARSAAALVQGVERFDPALTFAGVVFNRLGRPGHLTYLQEALRLHVAMPLIGGLPKDEGLRMAERHLGLVTAEDRPLDEAAVQALVDRIEAGIDLDALLERLPDIHVPPPCAKTTLEPLDVRIGVARDRAFCFYYPDNLELLEAAGARLAQFSPLEDDRLPDNLDGIYLGGGYPELHAEKLAGNETLRQAILENSRAGMPIYAECGGFMYLCHELRDLQGRSYPMCGCFPFTTRMSRKLKTLGYREVRLRQQNLLGGKNAVLRGHEFHYSDLVGDAAPEDIETAYVIGDRQGKGERVEGYQVNRTLGSYVHLHFGSRPQSAAAFVDACREYRKERLK